MRRTATMIRTREDLEIYRGGLAVLIGNRESGEGFESQGIPWNEGEFAHRSGEGYSAVQYRFSSKGQVVVTGERFPPQKEGNEMKNNYEEALRR